MLQCFSAALVLLMAILVIAQAHYLNFQGLRIVMCGFQSVITVKVSSYEKVSTYGIIMGIAQGLAGPTASQTNKFRLVKKGS